MIVQANISSGTGGGTVTGTGVANQVAYWSAPTVLTSSSVFVFTGSNVGIGAGAAPTARLHVGNGTTGGTPPAVGTTWTAYFYGNAALGTYIGIDNDNNAAYGFIDYNQQGVGKFRVGLSANAALAEYYYVIQDIPSGGVVRFGLDKNGNMQLGNIYPTGSALLSMGQGAAGKKFLIYDDTTNKNFIGFGIVASETRFFITNDSAQTWTFGTMSTTDGTTYSERIRWSATSMTVQPHGAAAGNTYEIRYAELAANGTNYFATKAADSMATTRTMVWPNDDPVAGEFLKVTSFAANLITTEWSDAGYTSFAVSGNISPADGEVWYIGAISNSASTTAALSRLYFPKAGTIKAIYVQCHNSNVLGTNEASTVAFRLNDTTDTTISNALTNDAIVTTVNNTGLGIAVAAGDYGQIKWTAATYATNPTNVRFSVIIYVALT